MRSCRQLGELSPCPASSEDTPAGGGQSCKRHTETKERSQRLRAYFSETLNKQTCTLLRRGQDGNNVNENQHRGMETFRSAFIKMRIVSYGVRNAPW